MTINAIISLVLVVFLVPWEAYAGQVGSPAPSFSEKDHRGRLVTLDDFKGKVVFVNFWAPWCVPCRDELPELDRLYKKHQLEGFVVIGISVEASRSGVYSFLKKVPVTFPILIDATGHIAGLYRISGLPAGFLVDRTGVVHKRYWGFEQRSLSIYETDIAELLNQK
jgi:peroxiredoxin